MDSTNICDIIDNSDSDTNQTVFRECYSYRSFIAIFVEYKDEEKLKTFYKMNNLTENEETEETN